MANPKYADLPGIATDQPDVYETSDLPESDQSHSLAETALDHSDNVEQINLSVKDAYNCFKDKSLDARNVDFTDSIGKKNGTGYGSHVEWELLDNASKEKETPLQTYNRLQFEIKDLYQKVDQLKTSSDSSSSCPTVLTGQIEMIQKDLQSLHLEQVLGSEIIKEMSDPLGTLHKKLLLQIENSKKKSLPDSKSKKAPISAGGASAGFNSALTYELYVNPELSKLQETAKVVELEQRMKNLESLIGQDRNKLSFLSSATDERSIVCAINLLLSKLNLLDPAYLEQIEGRLALLQQSMQQVSEKKQLIEDAEKQSKISELYELAKKVDGMSTSLPQVVDRLVALQELHNQALQFSKAITQLDTTQQQIMHTLRGNEGLMRKVQEAFEKNNETIDKNITSLNARLGALKK